MSQAFAITIVTSERKIVKLTENKKRKKERFYSNKREKIIDDNGERVRASMVNSAIYFCTNYFINVRKMLTMNKIMCMHIISYPPPKKKIQSHTLFTLNDNLILYIDFFGRQNIFTKLIPFSRIKYRVRQSHFLVPCNLRA